MTIDEGEAIPVKRVTAFVGSSRKRYTYEAARKFLDMLEARGDVESEIVRLSEYDVRTCRGCKLCFDKGEESCPLKDDRDVLIAKMTDSDGVVFASPNYSFQVSGLMKVFLDRLGFAMHRQRFQGRTSTSIVVQGIYGGQKLVKYLDFAGMSLGFDVVKGSYSTSFEPMTDKERAKRDAVLAKHAGRFYRHLSLPPDHAPTLMQLVGFHLGRTSIPIELPPDHVDHRYWADRGWLESDYYIPVRLRFWQRAAGPLLDALFKSIYTRRARGRPAGT